jgi:hypothetical protein
LGEELPETAISAHKAIRNNGMTFGHRKSKVKK